MSFPYDSSWTSNEVGIRQMIRGTNESGPPEVSGGALWVDQDVHRAYTWGGSVQSNIPDQGSDVWQMDTDGNGRASWKMSWSRNSGIENLQRVYDGSSTVCNRVGYYFNGIADSSNDSNQTSHFNYFPGLVTYDMDSSQWTNESSDALGYTSYGGKAVCVPQLSKKGLLLFLGGVRHTPSGENTKTYWPLNNITLYNPATKEWYWQNTSGTAPTAREGFCSIGVQGPNQTFEMYVSSKVLSVDDPETNSFHVKIPIWRLPLP